ncbi:MAG TPA: cytochrome c5 family protein [Gammaproteobacteria bacterium]|nr:cytochrome c5 family protein [Gammaproteobacteria bacterium]
MSDAAVLERIKPVGSFTASATAPAKTEAASQPPAKADSASHETPATGDSSGAPAPATAAPVASAQTKGARSGEEIFNTVCTACHSTGAAGAPKLGDKEAWAPRIATGVDAMLEVAIKGKNAMPPRGTCADCSDEELKKVIEYMVSKSQ